MAQTQTKTNTERAAAGWLCDCREARAEEKRARDFHISVFMGNGTSRDFRRWMEIVSLVPEGEKDYNDDHRDEITDFVQSIQGFQECDEDIETWMACDAEDCGFQILNVDEIVTSVQEESDPVDDETDEDEDNNIESSKGPSNADAFSVLEKAMEWYEQQSECCPTQLLLLKRTRHLSEKKRRCTMVQRKISDYFPQ
ncbi:hypothetical protein TNCV_1886021 [Trichonephila clavipes]|nr:hypothetical protein TNCV_1886021 [Trichonephila clavipes]